MSKSLKMFLIIIGFPLLIAGNAYFYFSEKARQLPEVPFTLLDGKTINIDALKGQAVLINFWATSCAPCRKEIPDLVTLHQEFAERGLIIVGVAMAHDRPDQVIAFKQQYKIPYTIALDINSAVANAYAVQHIPVTLLVSPRGQIEFRQSGVINIESMRQKIAVMLPEKES